MSRTRAFFVTFGISFGVVLAGYMVLSADVKVSYGTVCARCVEPVSNVLEISFEKDIASSGEVSSENDDYIIIEDKKDGFLFDGGMEDMAEKINIALECDDSIRQAAMEKAQSYSKENCARMLLELYDHVIDAKKKRLASKQKKRK